MKKFEKYLRPIYVFAHGPSLELVEKNIAQLIEKDVDWGSFNRFSIIEDRILSKFNKKFDVIYSSSEERYLQELENIREHKGVFITNHEIALKYGVEKALVTSFGYGFNTLFAFLLALMKIGYPDIYIFGADGGSEDQKELYFGQSEYDREDFKARQNSIERDTKFMNKYFWELADYWGIPKRNIYNVGLSSKIECFEKISIFDLLS